MGISQAGLRLFHLSSSTLTQAPVKLIFKLLIVSKGPHVDIGRKILSLRVQEGEW